MAIENEFGAGLTDAELAGVGPALRKVITWPITPGRAGRDLRAGRARGA
jgi:hypothetical protein